MKHENQGPSANSRRTKDLAAAKRRKQFGLIAVLLIVLVIVITSSPSNDKPLDSNASVPTARVVSLKPSETQPPVNAKVEMMQRFLASDDLPSMSLDQIVSRNLFARPQIEVAVPVTVAPSRPSSVSMPNVDLKVGAVYGRFNGLNQSALIGGRIIQSGEEIEPGIKILTISPEGVQVTP